MPKPGEPKTVQARILAYAQEIGWPFVPRAEAEKRRGFDPDKLEKALAFDSDEINAIVKDLGLLKVLFKNKMEHFDASLPELREELQDYVIVHELLHFHAPNHGKLWKSLMRVASTLSGTSAEVPWRTGRPMQGRVPRRLSQQR